MTDDFGRRKPDRWRRRRTHDSAPSGTADDGTAGSDTDASGWLAAQFQEPGDTDTGRSGRPTAHTDAGNTGGQTAEPPPPTGGFRWGLTLQSPAAVPRATTQPAAIPIAPPDRPAPEPPAHPAPPRSAPTFVPAGDPFLPADPHLAIVPPGLPVTAAPAVPPAGLPSDASVVPPPDRVLPTELFTPVPPGEPTEPLVSRRTFRPRPPAEPAVPGAAPAAEVPPAAFSPAAASVPHVDPAPPPSPSLGSPPAPSSAPSLGSPPAPPPAPPLIPATVHRDTENSPLAALFRERERQVIPADPTVRMPSVPAAAQSPDLPHGSRRGRAETRRVPGSGWSGNTKLLLWSGGAVLAVLALIGLFFLGTRLPELFGSAPAPASATNALERVSVSPSPTPSASPSPSAPPVSQVAAVGPLAPGTYSWQELRGGECLSGYESPWAEEFTVVDCAAPHPAQLVHRAAFAPADATAYPGVEALQAQINLLCSAPTVINFAVAGAYNDIQFAGSYAVNQQEWAAGQRDYFCFVTRSSGEPLTGSIAVPVG